MNMASRDLAAAAMNAGLASNDTSLPGVADTLAKLRDLLQERYGIEKSTVEMESQLSSLGLDSLSLVECAFDLESVFHIALSDLPHELSTIGDLVHYVSKVRSRTELAPPVPDATK